MIDLFSSDAILQTIGTICGTTIGAFLGGYFAVRVMNKQIEFQKNLIANDKNERFEKTYWLIKVVFEVLGEAMISANKSLTDPALEKPNYGYIMGKLISCLDQANSKLNDINDEHISHEIYKTYLGGKTLVEGSRLIISGMHNRYHNSKDNFSISDDEIKDLKSYGKGLIQILNEIDEYRNKK
jgi:hypothetical protein